MKEQELKPCPFCGHPKPEVLTTLMGQYRWMVQCDKRECRASTNNFEHQTEAIRAWNKRAASEADSVSRTQPAESASVIPQGPAGAGEQWTVEDRETGFVRLNFDGNQCTFETDRRNVPESIALVHNATVTALSARASEAEKTVYRLVGLKDRVVAAARENKDESDALRSSLLQHESVIEKLRTVLQPLSDRWNETEVWHAMKPSDSAWLGKIHITVRDLHDIAKALALQPSPSHLEAWFQEKVKPLVEALEKIVASHSPAEYACQIASEALAQLKPETKL